MASALFPLLQDQVPVPVQLVTALREWQEQEGLHGIIPLSAQLRYWEAACAMLHQRGATPAQILVLLAGPRWPARSSNPRQLKEALRTLPIPYTQQMLAQALGVTRQILHRWGVGRAVPTATHRQALQEVFGPLEGFGSQAPKWEQFIRSKGLWAEYEAFQ